MILVVIESVRHLSTSIHLGELVDTIAWYDEWHIKQIHENREREVVQYDQESQRFDSLYDNIFTIEILREGGLSYVIHLFDFLKRDDSFIPERLPPIPVCKMMVFKRRLFFEQTEIY